MNVHEHSDRHVQLGGPPDLLVGDGRSLIHRFVLVLDRTPSADPIQGLPGAVLLHDTGTVTTHTRLRLDWPAPSLPQAVAGAVRAVEATGVRVLRVDVDNWVTAGQVACRIGRSRETVRLWASGRTGPGGFPPPVNPWQDITFFSWAEVLEWLRDRACLDLPDEELALLAANLAIQLRALLPRLTAPRAIIELITRPTVGATVATSRPDPRAVAGPQAART